MAFRITITEVAKRQFKTLSAREQRVLETAIVGKLREEPTTPTHSVKCLRSNPFAGFELRSGDLRVLYNVEVENQEVVLLIVGRKVGNKLVVEGEEFHEHHSDSIEPTSGEPDCTSD